MIRRTFLEQIHCPYCGSGLRVERELCVREEEILYGIVQCSCYRYPIIDGILILRQTSQAANTTDQAVVLLEAEDTNGAFRFLIESSPVAPNRMGSQWFYDAIKRRLRRMTLRSERVIEDVARSATTLREAVAVLRPSSYGSYLVHRYANNSFLAALPLLLLAKELRSEAPVVLDVNCGVGHASFILRSVFPELSVIATDHDFVNLYMARRYMVPDGTFVCMDTEAALPFADGCFEAAVCMDGLHYVRGKQAFLRELARTIRQDGIWLFPHMHNAAAANFSPGVPLRAADYRRIFDFLPSRLLVEADVFRRFMQQQVLDLEGSAAESSLQAAAVFSLVGSRRSDLWRMHENLGSLLAQATAPLHLNPIYNSVPDGEMIKLQMAWPSGNLERECEAVKQFLPQTCSIPADLLHRLQRGVSNSIDDAELHNLRKSFVVVPLPPAYV